MKKLILFFVVLAAAGCGDKKTVPPPLYERGDIVYTKPDSILGVVSLVSWGFRQEWIYSLRFTEITDADYYASEIFGKKTENTPQHISIAIDSAYFYEAIMYYDSVMNLK